MKTIKYNNKEYKMPFDVELPEDPTVEVEIKNRFTGEATTMPEFAAAVYDTIIGSEMFGDYDTVRKGLDWFKTTLRKTIHGSTRLIHIHVCVLLDTHSPTTHHGSLSNSSTG